MIKGLNYVKKTVFTLSTLLVLFFHMSFLSYAQESVYTIEQVHPDGTTSELFSTASYNEAVSQYTAYAQADGNVLLRDQNRIWMVKYGVAILSKSDTCDMNISFTQGKESGYTNACYGIDAAYLSTSADGSTMELVLSNAFGTFSSDDVTLIPIEQSTRPSIYQVKQGKLYHQVKSQMEDDRSSASIKLGVAPKELAEDTSYYSYDSHYFYPVEKSFQGYYDMIDDLRSGTHTHAVNADAPYYNYYQYLTHRSTTKYSEEEINSYFDEHLHISSGLTSYKSIGTSAHAILTQSILKNQAAAFLQYQDEIGVNAMMMLSLSMNESAMGRSYLAYTRNNLFGHAAFDSAVEENAARYQNASKSIYSHALHYINDSYLNPTQFQFHGGWFGNKASGMNVSYASDPYWGEKAAQYYQRIDEALGYKDENAYALGVVASAKEVAVHKEASEDSEILYTNEGNRDFSFLLLEKQGEWYKVQSESSSSTTSIYNYENSIGYVKQTDIDVVLHPESIREKHRILIDFDAVDGAFENGTSKLTLEVEAGNTPSVLAPEKSGYLFVDWDQEIKPASRAITYTAQYEEVLSASITTLPKQEYEAGDFLDVKGGILTITLANGEVKEIPLDTTMVSGFDNETAKQQTLQVKYQGVNTTYDVHVSQGGIDQEELKEGIQALLSEIVDEESISTAQKEQLLLRKQQLDAQRSPTLTQEEYRKLDRCLQQVYGSSLQILLSAEDVDLQVSGLTISQPMEAPTLLPSVLKLSLDKGITEQAKERLSDVAIGNNYSLEEVFTLSGSYNLQDLSLQDDLILSIQKPESTQSNMQYLLLRYEDGEVVQVITSQSANRITFVSDATGEYALVSRAATNSYMGEDMLENNTIATNGFDFFRMLLYALILLLLLIIGLTTIVIRRKRNSKGVKTQHHTSRKRQQKQAVLQEESTPSFLKAHSIQADEPMSYKDEDLEG